MSEDVYLRLREFMDGLPGGYPETETGVELKILEKLFTPEQAEMVMKLSQVPETAEAVAGRTGLDFDYVSRMLESMAAEGLIYRFRVGEDTLFIAMQFVVGVYEFHLNSLDRELAWLFEEYLPYLADSWRNIKTKQLRVVPVEETLDPSMAVASYDQIRELMKGQDRIAVAPCICRREQELLGNPCDRPRETCFTFGYAADYYDENGLGRKISKKEAFEILRKAEESALVLASTNARDVVNLCCCCGCCCGALRMLKATDNPEQEIHSSYVACIEEGLCVGCETCLERCQVDAIRETTEAMQVVASRCIGCGLCVTTCPQEAISLKAKEGMGEPPSNIVEMFRSMAVERDQAR